MPRMFLAVFPPRETQALAASAIHALKEPGDGVSWVKPDNLHFTMRFIGDVGEDGAKRLEAAALEAASAHRCFGATLGPPGAFPTAKRARVLWLGMLDGVEPFAQLAHSLERSLAKRGFEPEGGEFTAHLTIGRVRVASDWTRALIGAPSFERSAAARFTVGAISVVESELSSGGSRYRVRARAALAE
jgi:2'-5' RNA ligase